MISRLSVLVLGLLLNAAHASEPAPRTGAAAAPAARAAAAPKPAASPEEARREIGELRERIGVLSRRMAELSMQLGDVGPQAYAFRYLNDSDRAMIGVVLSAEPKGARIDAVTPDGPAERAGLHSGDLLASINGEDLAASSPEVSLEKARKLLGDLKPGEAVRLGYRRGGREMAIVEVKAERREAWNWQRLFADDDGERDVEVVVDRDHRGASEGKREVLVRKDVEKDFRTREERYERMHEAMAEARRAMREARLEIEKSHRGLDVARADGASPATDDSFALMPWWGLNLASLNPDLGRYFGAESGVLVLSASRNALKELRAGDVIRKVGTQPVERPEQVLRALRDRRSGETVELVLLRERKDLTIPVAVPEYKAIFDIRSLPVPPAPPAPPVPPAPVTAAAPPVPASPASPATPASPPAPPPPPAPPVHDDLPNLY